MKKIVIALALAAATVAVSAQSKKIARTPWGDPDIQGNYTNLYEDGTPLERPAQFDGPHARSNHGHGAGQAQDRSAGADDQQLRGADSRAEQLVAGRARSAIAGARRGSSPIRRTATCRVDAGGPAARRGRATPIVYDGGSDSWEDRTLYDRCITRGLPGSMMPAIYGNSYQIVQGPGYVAIQLRDDSRDARDPARRPAARRRGHPPGHGRRARPLGGRHARRRDDELQRRAASTATPTPTR